MNENALIALLLLLPMLAASIVLLVWTAWFRPPAVDWEIISRIARKSK